MSMRLPGASYKTVFDRGRVLRGRLLTLYAWQTQDAGNRAGVVISRKSFHDATDRNRAKRILRAGHAMARAALVARLGPCECVLVGRRALEGRKAQDVARELESLAGRCGKS